MRIESIRTLNGPNVYSYHPVLLMSLDLGELVERESRSFHGFNDKLLTLLPGIHNHHCSLGRPGGFVTRLEEGTYFGHIVEYVALELTVREKSFQLQPVLEQAKELVLDADVGPTTRAITQAAEKRGIPLRRDGTGNRIRLGYGKYLRYVQAAMTSQTSAIAVELAQDKDETKERLARLIGLDVCGVDLVIPDIATEMTSGGVIELNASPGLRMHHFPSAGMPRDVGRLSMRSIGRAHRVVFQSFRSLGRR